MPETNGYQNALLAMDRFTESLLDCYSPFEFATTLVRATAQQYNADIATLFRVSPSRTELIAEAGYDQKGEQLRANAAYSSLPWGALKQKDMKGIGLTAWVAVSGQPLFIRDSEELLDTERNPAHRGAWDSELHPEGPECTFGCLYAVPLRIGANKPPQESILGVYKIERRKGNRDGVFNSEQLREFDLAAKQLSLVILLYERAMARILSDARHAVQGRMGDVINQLDQMAIFFDRSSGQLFELSAERKAERLAKRIPRVKDDATKVASWLRQSMQTYMNPIEIEKRNVGEFIRDTIEARENQQYEVRPSIADRDRSEKLRMSLAQSWDLHTLLLSLLNNALQHSGAPDSVLFKAEIRKNDRPEARLLVVTIEDRGPGIPENIINQVQEESGPVVLTASSLMAPSGTGLRRIYRVAKFREWQVDYESCTPHGARFRVSIGIPTSEQGE